MENSVPPVESPLVAVVRHVEGGARPRQHGMSLSVKDTRDISIPRGLLPPRRRPEVTASRKRSQKGCYVPCDALETINTTPRTLTRGTSRGGAPRPLETPPAIAVRTPPLRIGADTLFRGARLAEGGEGGLLPDLPAGFSAPHPAPSVPEVRGGEAQS